MTEEQVKESSDSLLDVKSPPALDFTSGKPEGFPDEFWDEEKKSPVVDKLYNSYAQEKKRAEGLRVKLSKGEFEGKPPEDIKEYVLQLDEKYKDTVPDDDVLLMEARKAAKEAGLPKDTFNKFIGPVIAKVAELKASIIEPSPEEIEQAKEAEIAKLGPSGHKIVEAVNSWVNELQTGGSLSAEEAQAARNMVYDADSARVMNKLRVISGYNNQVPIEVPIDNKASKSDVEAKLAEAFAKNNEAEYQKWSSMLAKMNN